MATGGAGCGGRGGETEEGGLGLTWPGEMNSLMTLFTTSDAGKKSISTYQVVNKGTETMQ